MARSNSVPQRARTPVDREGSERLRSWLAGLLLIAPLIFWRGAIDAFSLPKATVVIFVSVLSGGWTVRWWLRRGSVMFPSPLFATSVAVFLGAGVIAWVRSPLTWASLLGQYGRWSGFALYAALGMLSLAAASAAAFDRTVGRYVLRSLLASASLVGAYAAIQWFGWDPLDWESFNLPSTFSTMGNVNFTSALLGMATPLGIVEIARRGSPTSVRWVCAAALTTLILGLLAADSLQGPLIAGVGSAIVLLGIVGSRTPLGAAVARRPYGVAATGVLVAAGFAAVVAVSWERLVAAAGIGSEARLHFWETALRLAGDRPVLGWGFDTFGYWFTRYRPVDHALRFGHTVSDEPHNVWLSMQVSGGALLLVAYLAVVVVVALRIPYALRNADDDRRLEVVGLVAVWVTYHLQSLISMDQPALAAVHWVAAGTIVGLGGRPDGGWVWQIPRVSRQRRHALAGLPVSAATAVLVLVAMVPLGIDVWTRTGLVAATAAPSAEQRVEGFDRLADAVEWAPWTGIYAFRRAEVLYGAGSVEGAYESQVAAIERTPGQPRYVMNAANMAREMGQEEASVMWWRRAAAVDRHHPDVLRSAASFLRDLGHEDEAQALLRRVSRLERGAR